eukprot:TRINITY_DN1218_c0_g1_i4.p1 TRINITY_DN1218_c0_g1~~TRINITY_DN1218_c0_g1_i4.p1  ORF type:complete len:230 (+),score=81.92 TRINITY_DN1218_c0_g1_i4:1380-2069(+)
MVSNQIVKMNKIVIMMIVMMMMAMSISCRSSVDGDVINDQGEVKSEAGASAGKIPNGPPKWKVVEHCDRKISRLVRHRLNEYFFPTVEKEQYELPERCPFRKEKDYVMEQELQKEKTYEGKWKCKKCEKQFLGETYLDKHLQRRHPFQIEELKGKVCLADFEDIALHIQLDGAGSVRNKKEDEEYQKWRKQRYCTAEFVEKQRFLCQAIMYRCFPADGGEKATRLHGLL